MDTDTDRTSAAIGDNPIIDLQCSLPAITAIATLCQGAGRAFKPAGRQIVEDKATVFEVTACQLLLDTVLPDQQPVHCRIDSIFGLTACLTANGLVRGAALRVDDNVVML